MSRLLSITPVFGLHCIRRIIGQTELQIVIVIIIIMPLIIFTELW